MIEEKNKEWVKNKTVQESQRKHLMKLHTLKLGITGRKMKGLLGSVKKESHSSTLRTKLQMFMSMICKKYFLRLSQKLKLGIWLRSF